MIAKLFSFIAPIKVLSSLFNLESSRVHPLEREIGNSLVSAQRQCRRGDYRAIQIENLIACMTKPCLSGRIVEIGAVKAGLKNLAQQIDQRATANNSDRYGVPMGLVAAMKAVNDRDCGSGVDYDFPDIFPDDIMNFVRELAESQPALNAAQSHSVYNYQDGVPHLA